MQSDRRGRRRVTFQHEARAAQSAVAEVSTRRSAGGQCHCSRAGKNAQGLTRQGRMGGWQVLRLSGLSKGYTWGLGAGGVGR